MEDKKEKGRRKLEFSYCGKRQSGDIKLKGRTGHFKRGEGIEMDHCDIKISNRRRDQ